MPPYKIIEYLINVVYTDKDAYNILTGHKLGKQRKKVIKQTINTRISFLLIYFLKNGLNSSSIVATTVSTIVN